MEYIKEFNLKLNGHLIFYSVEFEIIHMTKVEFTESIDNYSNHVVNYNFDFKLSKIETFDEDGNELILKEINLPAEHLAVMRKEIYDYIDDNAADYYEESEVSLW